MAAAQDVEDFPVFAQDKEALPVFILGPNDTDGGPTFLNLVRLSDTRPYPYGLEYDDGGGWAAISTAQLQDPVFATGLCDSDLSEFQHQCHCYSCNTENRELEPWLIGDDHIYYGLHRPRPEDYLEGGNVNVEHHKIYQCYYTAIEQVCRHSTDMDLVRVMLPLISAQAIQQSNHPDMERILKESLSVIVSTVVYCIQYSNSIRNRLHCVTLCFSNDLEKQLLCEIFEETQQTMESGPHPGIVILNDVFDLVHHPGCKNCNLHGMPVYLQYGILHYEKYVRNGFDYLLVTKEELAFHLELVAKRDPELSKIFNYYGQGMRIYRLSIEQEQEMGNFLQTLFQKMVAREFNMKVLLSCYAKPFEKWWSDESKYAYVMLPATRRHMKKTLRIQISSLVHCYLSENWCNKEDVMRMLAERL